MSVVISLSGVLYGSMVRERLNALVFQYCNINLFLFSIERKPYSFRPIGMNIGRIIQVISPHIRPELEFSISSQGAL